MIIILTVRVLPPPGVARRDGVGGLIPSASGGPAGLSGGSQTPFDTPWSDTARESDKTRLYRYILDSPEGTPLAVLSVDHYLKVVFVVVHIAHRQVLQFPASCPGVERDGDESGIAGVPGFVYYRLYILFPAKHFRRVWDGVVAVTGSRWDPVDAFRGVLRRR